MQWFRLLWQLIRNGLGILGFWELLTSLGVGIVIIPPLYSFSEWVQALPQPYEVLFYIGIFIIIFLIVRLLWSALAPKVKRLLHLGKPQADQPTSIEIGEGTIKLRELGFEFYDSRSTLGKERPLRKQLETAHEVWALWNTGSQHGRFQVVEGSGNLKRLMLAHPSKSSLEFLAKTFGQTKESLTDDILYLSRVAQTKRIEIKWFENLTACTIMIGNPRDDDGWIHIETVIPSLATDQRPSFRITKSNQPKLFRAIVKAYEDLWDTSKTPSKRELGKAKA